MFASLTSRHSRLRLESEAAGPAPGTLRASRCWLLFGLFGLEVDRARADDARGVDVVENGQSVGSRSSPLSARKSRSCNAQITARTSRTTRSRSGARTTPLLA